MKQYEQSKLQSDSADVFSSTKVTKFWKNWTWMACAVKFSLITDKWLHLQIDMILLVLVMFIKHFPSQGQTVEWKCGSGPKFDSLMSKEAFEILSRFMPLQV